MTDYPSIRLHFEQQNFQALFHFYFEKQNFELFLIFTSNSKTSSSFNCWNTFLLTPTKFMIFPDAGYWILLDPPQ